MSLAGPELFRRDATLTIGSVRIRDLRFKFSVHKNLKKEEANKAEISVYNLNPKHRSELEQQNGKSSIPVTLEAGYLQGTSVIYSGQLRTVVTKRDAGVDLITTIGSGDGEKAIQTSRASKSFAPGAPAAEFFRYCAKAVGVKDGNLDQAVSLLSAQVGSAFVGGTVIFGSATRELTYLCRCFNLEWSIQDGKLQLTKRGMATADRAILLNKSTGMLDSPSVDSKGVLTVKMLLQAGVFPGRLISLDAERLKGNYKIEESTHKGDTHTDEWCIEVKASAY